MKFPGIYSFQIKNNLKTGEKSIFSTEIETKSKLDNIKFSAIKGFFWDGSESAVIKIRVINSKEGLITELIRLTEIWLGNGDIIDGSK